TSIVVTHDMRSACEVGDRILMLWNGRFLADGTPDELMQAEDEHVRRFVQGVAEPTDLATLTGR
ncbi:MAG: ABC transporter ATP-binding protein, partial [Phycisphaerae bacterium]|nr:ABC transporter ATP-binding protein [Phycisphaerae bacterium]